MEEKVIDFKKDDKFYFDKANQLLFNNEFLPSIRYFHKAIDLAKDKTAFLRCSYYLVLAQAYAKIELFDLSNFYYFKALENDVFAQLVFRGLGENFYSQNEVLISKFYLNQCINLYDASQVAASAKEKLAEINKIEKPKLRVVNEETTVLSLDEQRKIEKYISNGKFNDVIMLMEEKKDFSNPKLRAELALAYFFTNNNKKGIELIEKFGDGSLTDLCNLLLMYFNSNDEKNYNKIKEELLNFKIEDDEQYFKIGLTLAQTEQFEKAKEYMKLFLNRNPFEVELKFLYAITCLNCNDRLEAKNIFIDLKTLDPFNSYVLNYYLNLCNSEESVKLQYIFNLPLSEYSKVQNIVKEIILFSNLDLLNFFNNHEDLFYFLARNEETLLVKSLFLKLSKIDDENVREFFDYVLISENFKDKTKGEIALNLLSQDSNFKVSLVRNKIYTKIVLPNNLATKSNNQKLFEAMILSVKFILFEVFLMNVNLKREIIKLERIIKQSKVDEFVLASFICWDYLKDKKVATLNKICKYFAVSQQDFYKFLEEYNLEVWNNINLNFL